MISIMYEEEGCKGPHREVYSIQVPDRGIHVEKTPNDILTQKTLTIFKPE